MAAVKKVKKGTYQMAAYNPRKKKAKKKVSKAARSRAAKKGARTRARKKVARSKAGKKGARTRARCPRRRRNPAEPATKKVTAKKTNPKKATAKKANPKTKSASKTIAVAGKSLTVYKTAGHQHRWMLRDGRTIVAGGAEATLAAAQAAGTARAGGRINPAKPKAKASTKTIAAAENPRKRRKKTTKRRRRNPVEAPAAATENPRKRRKVRRRRNPVEPVGLTTWEKMLRSDELFGASGAAENPRKRRRKTTTRRKVRRRRNPAGPVRKTERVNPGRIRALTKI